MGDFVTVSLGKDKPTIKIEKGCSFENNGAIYYVDNDGNLNVYDKKTSVWSKGSSITINNYQLNTLKAIADNTNEMQNGEFINGIVLSKQDIKAAMTQHRKGNLTDDLSSLLNGTTYRAENTFRYTDANAVSAYITNGNEKTSGNLVFKFGTKEDAIALSNYINNQKTNTGFFDKLKGFFVNNEKTQEVKETPKQEPIAVVEQVEKAEKVKPVQTTTETPQQKKSNAIKTPEKASFLESMPKYYNLKIDTISTKMGLTKEELEQEISRVAQNTGYSEYFVTHLVSMEDYEKTIRDTNDGTITGGFGHSKGKDKTLEEGDPVTPKQAFDWLEEDIKYFENIVKDLKVNKKTGKTYGDYFDELPLSMREGLIDVAFNRDASKLENDSEYNSLRANLELGYYHKAAVRIRQKFPYTLEQAKKHKFTTGLMERNVYRFLLAVRDFEPEEIASAKRAFENDGYYKNALALKAHKGLNYDITLMKNAWNTM